MVSIKVPLSRAQKAALLLALVLSLASVSYSCRRTFELVDERAAPIDPAYVAYTFVGTNLNPVHPVSYRAKPLTLVRSDATGRVIVPGAWLVHMPFPFQTHPSFDIQLVYVPRLHSALGNLNQHSTLRGTFAMVTPPPRTTVSDRANNPEVWAGTLDSLSSLINQLVAPHVDGPKRVSRDPTTISLTHELIAHFRQEYEAFVSQHGEVARPVPEMPPYARWSTAEEQRLWKESVERDLALEPTWGVMVKRLHASELEYFEDWRP